MKTWLWVMLMTSTAVLAATLVWVLAVRQTAGSPVETGQVTPFRLAGKGEPWPKVVLDKTEHDFGTMDVHEENEYAFEVRNEGEAPLMLKVGQTTCKCTIGRLLRDEIAPGKSAKVHLQWKTMGPTENFRQSAEILTNDPDRPRFGLVITGKVLTRLGMVPTELAFSDASAHEDVTRNTTLFSQTADDFQVTKVESTSQHLSWKILPLDNDLLKGRRAKCGHQFAVTVDRTIPLGRFSETMTIYTDVPDAEPLQLLVKGMMSGDVSIYGSEWDSELAYLKIGAVPRETGAERELHLYARGPYRNLQPEDFEIRKDPDFLKVSLNRDPELTGPTAPAHFIVTIGVPADAPPVNHLGSQGASLAEVRLVPKDGEKSGAVGVRLGVQFAVQR